MSKVFVYGTLKKGHGNHRILAGRAAFAGNAKIGKGYTAYSNGRGYPFLAEVPGNGCVGEVYNVTDDVLAELDRLEGHPGYYVRKTCGVDLGGGSTAKVFAYIMPGGIPETATIIEDWQR